MQERTLKTCSTGKTGSLHVKVQVSDASRPKVQCRKLDVTIDTSFKTISHDITTMLEKRALKSAFALLRTRMLHVKGQTAPKFPYPRVIIIWTLLDYRSTRPSKTNTLNTFLASSKHKKTSNATFSTKTNKGDLSKHTSTGRS